MRDKQMKIIGVIILLDSVYKHNNLEFKPFIKIDYESKSFSIVLNFDMHNYVQHSFNTGCDKAIDILRDRSIIFNPLIESVPINRIVQKYHRIEFFDPKEEIVFKLYMENPQ